MSDWNDLTEAEVRDELAEMNAGDIIAIVRRNHRSMSDERLELHLRAVSERLFEETEAGEDESSLRGLLEDLGGQVDFLAERHQKFETLEAGGLWTRLRWLLTGRVS